MSMEKSNDPDQVINNLSKHFTWLLSHANVGQLTADKIDQMQSNDAVQLLPITDLANIPLGASILNISNDTERLLQMIQFYKLEQIHNNSTNKLNIQSLQSEQFSQTHSQNLASIETLLSTLSMIVSDIEDYQNNSILQFMDNE